MREKSKIIHSQLVTERCKSRVNQVWRIADSFRFSRPHPHDFYPSTADICWVPEVRKAIVDGTDEEFQECIADIRSRISDWSAKWFEERRNVFLQLLPQDPPSPKHFSLVTTLFDCAKCCSYRMRIEGALSHHCSAFCYGDGFDAQFPNSESAMVYRHFVGSPWNSGFAEYRYSAEYAALAREIVLECGENPDTVTIQEMNKKQHRFARFDSDKAVTVLDWIEAVSSRTLSPDYFTPHLYPAVRPITSVLGT
jgi:hypothetical protein